MKRIQYHAYGGPEVMRLAEFVPETPGTGEVSVAVRFAAVNPIDWKMRAGAMKIVMGGPFPAPWAWIFRERSSRSAPA